MVKIILYMHFLNQFFQKQYICAVNRDKNHAKKEI